ncbi:MAG TPA: hypothetical protein VH138_04590 [Vicinamibacterales bacterium]|jgi:hypothetical protein|nr:hypothetical protein [Vicinamibacterales bacterium]
MTDQRKTEREEPQHTSLDEDRIRGIADQEDEFEDDEDSDEDAADEEDEGTI